MQVRLDRRLPHSFRPHRVCVCACVCSRVCSGWCSCASTARRTAAKLTRRWVVRTHHHLVLSCACLDAQIERLKQVLKPDGEFKDLRQFDSPIRFEMHLQDSAASAFSPCRAVCRPARSIAVRPEVTVTGMIQGWFARSAFSSPHATAFPRRRDHQLCVLRPRCAEQTTMFKSALAPLLAAFNTPDGSRFKASLLAEPIFT